ncbi:hypothetical protein BCV69DRAFT_283826 [Microstroma glucosiphilum]|uniref:Uncharacterized protein n=1 Tax=Pseudomicrostroma glucosiphilum TaxID=1684307 RepID=A0A316U326_9BASI|nr:hypothetical protein BCV69DRAFT_283826 [Pseudomicrostroma glucosiphilum]PWN19719.1 hypothetical protein BCV69DRAFT_283826 [Pseudomicrostroma glucosiphilum]
MLGHLKRPTALAALGALLLVLANSATAAPLIDRRAEVAVDSVGGEDLVARVTKFPVLGHPGRVPYKTPIRSAPPGEGVNDPNDPPRRKPHPPKREEFEARAHPFPSHEHPGRVPHKTPIGSAEPYPGVNDPKDPPRRKPHPPKREEVEARGYGRLPPEHPDPIDPYYHPAPPTKPKKPHPPQERDVELASRRFGPGHLGGQDPVKSGHPTPFIPVPKVDPEPGSHKKPHPLRREEVEARGPVHGPISPPVDVPGDEPTKPKPKPPHERDAQDDLHPIKRGREVGNEPPERTGLINKGGAGSRIPPKKHHTHPPSGHLVKRGPEAGYDPLEGHGVSYLPPALMPPEHDPHHHPSPHKSHPPRDDLSRRGREAGYVPPKSHGIPDLPGKVFPPKHGSHNVPPPHKSHPPSEDLSRRGREAGYVPPKGTNLHLPPKVFPPKNDVPPPHKSHPPNDDLSRRGRDHGSDPALGNGPIHLIPPGRPSQPSRRDLDGRATWEESKIAKGSSPLPGGQYSHDRPGPPHLKRGREAGHIGRKPGGISSPHRPPVADPHDDPPSKDHPPVEELSKRGREKGHVAPPEHIVSPPLVPDPHEEPPPHKSHPLTEELSRRGGHAGGRSGGWAPVPDPKPPHADISKRGREAGIVAPASAIVPQGPPKHEPDVPSPEWTHHLKDGAPGNNGPPGNNGKRDTAQGSELNARQRFDLPPEPQPKLPPLPPIYRGGGKGNGKKLPPRRSLIDDDNDFASVLDLPPEQRPKEVPIYRGRGKRPPKRSVDDDDSPSHRDHKPREPHPRANLLKNRQGNDDDDSPSHRDHKPREPHP